MYEGHYKTALSIDDRPHLYGLQRLWGSLGFGIVSLLAGLLVDVMSDGQLLKDYSIVFYLAIGFVCLGIGNVTVMHNAQEPRSTRIATSVGHLLLSPRIIVFALWLVVVGVFTTAIRSFLYWHLEELGEARQSCDVDDARVSRSKTLQGLVSAVQSFGGEVPMFFFACAIVRRLGHVHVMSLVLGSFAVRFAFYSILRDPWWTLPIEFMHGLTMSLFQTVMTAYATLVAPRGTAATVQGLAGAAVEGVGMSLGNLVAGYAMQHVGGAAMYRYMSYAAAVAFVGHVGVQWLLERWCPVEGAVATEAERVEVTEDMLVVSSADNKNSMNMAERKARELLE